MSGSKQIPQAGFSLVELLVALVFTAILTTGMLRIFASNVSGFYTHQETLGLQRNSRYALNLVQEDVLQAGYLFPPRVLKGDFTIGSDAVQPPLLLARTGYTPVWTDANGTVSSDLTPVDQIQFVQDVNLEVEGTLSGAVASGATSANVTIPSGLSSLTPFLHDTAAGGNPLVMVMMDSQQKQVDMVRVLNITGTGPYNVVFDTVYSGVDQYGNLKGGGFFTSNLNNDHAANAPCTFIAPLQVVRYTVVSRKLDPSSTNVTPCLVRQTAPLDKAAIFASGINAATPPAAGDLWSEQIIAEGVVGFRADISIDGGKNWLRYKPDGTTLNAGLDTWSGTYTALDLAIKGALGATSPMYAYTKLGLSNPADPIWFNYLPVTIRLDLDTRSRVARTEFNAASTGTAPSATFRTRTVSMLITPRNFGLGNPQ